MIFNLELGPNRERIQVQRDMRAARHAAMNPVPIDFGIAEAA
ncbi:hypothetical protein [Thiomonas sp.]